MHGLAVPVSKIRHVAVHSSAVLCQMLQIAEIFYFEDRYVRYNTYLIFVSRCRSSFNDQTTIQKIEQDLDYSRKLFLAVEDLSAYFLFPNVPIPPNPCVFYEKYYESLKAYVEILSKYFLRGFLIDDKDDNECVKKLEKHVDNLINEFIDSYDSTIGDNVSWRNDNNAFLDLYFFNNTDASSKTSERSFLETISFNEFRPKVFGDSNKVNFKRVNAVYALNAAGKTSFLDAIYLAFTGQDSIHKEAGTVSVKMSDGMEYNSNIDTVNKCKMKATLYPNRPGTLKELFRSKNYFDLDAAYRFKYKEEKQLKILFANKRIQICVTRVNLLKEKLKEIINECVQQTKNVSCWINEVSVTGKSEHSFGKFRQQHEKYNQKKKYCENILNDLEKLETIDNEFFDEIEHRKNLTNKIFKKLHNFNTEIDVDKDEAKLYLKDIRDNQPKELWEISAAERSCLALSFMFARLLENKNAPGFVLLDEPINYLDDLHLLNLFDVLQALAIQNYQIIFSTASSRVMEIADVKFNFLSDEEYQDISWERDC